MGSAGFAFCPRLHGADRAASVCMLAELKDRPPNGARHTCLFRATESHMEFPEPIKTTGSGLRPLIRNTAEVIRLIDQDMSAELKRLPRWTFARELLLVADRSGKKRDLNHAYRQFRQALSNDRM